MEDLFHAATAPAATHRTSNGLWRVALPRRWWGHINNGCVWCRATCQPEPLRFTRRRMCTSLFPFKVPAKCDGWEKSELSSARARIQPGESGICKTKVFSPRHITSIQHRGRGHHCSYESALTAIIPHLHQQLPETHSRGFVFEVQPQSFPRLLRNGLGNGAIGHSRERISGADGEELLSKYPTIPSTRQRRPTLCVFQTSSAYLLISLANFPLNTKADPKQRGSVQERAAQQSSTQISC